MNPDVGPGVDHAVAQRLQDGLDLLNAEDPPGVNVQHFQVQAKHDCPAIGESDTFLLHEMYVTDWIGGEPFSDHLADTAIIYRQGRCSQCGLTARSMVGRAVLTSERPPLKEL